MFDCLLYFVKTDVTDKSLTVLGARSGNSKLDKILISLPIVYFVYLKSHRQTIDGF